MIRSDRVERLVLQRAGPAEVLQGEEDAAGVAGKEAAGADHSDSCRNRTSPLVRLEEMQTHPVFTM